MKYLTIIFAFAFLISSCNSSSSRTENSTDSTLNSTNADTSVEVVTPGANAPGAAVVDTNGHILKNGKVRMGNDKIATGDVRMADTTK